MKIKDLLQKIDAFERQELARLCGPEPAKPPVPIEEPSELVYTNTAYGGWWCRRKYADGTMSPALFRAHPRPRYLNAREVQEAEEAVAVWHANYRRNWPEVRLLSGSARNWFNGNISGRNCRALPPETLEELLEQYGDKIQSVDIPAVRADLYYGAERSDGIDPEEAERLSVSGRYAAELVYAAKKIGAL